MVDNEELLELNQVISNQHQSLIQFCNHIDKPVDQLQKVTHQLIVRSYYHHQYSIPEQLHILEFIENNR